MTEKLDPRTKEKVSDDLAQAMESAIKRLETIQETNPEIALNHDLEYYRSALNWYRRIPSLSKREKLWNTRQPAPDVLEAALQARPDSALVEELEGKISYDVSYGRKQTTISVDLATRILSALRTHDDTLKDAVQSSAA